MSNLNLFLKWMKEFGKTKNASIKAYVDVIGNINTDLALYDENKNIQNKNFQTKSELQQIIDLYKTLNLYNDHKNIDLYEINDKLIIDRIIELYKSIEKLKDKNERGHRKRSSGLVKYKTFIENSEKIKSTLIFNEQLVNDKNFYEGAVSNILIKKYKRDKNAREKCVEIYGYKCYVCNVKLKDVYGELGKNIIHVHHLKPLSEIQEKYNVNPKKDLRPVCPNCHAIIHSKNPIYTLEEVKIAFNNKKH